MTSHDEQPPRGRNEQLESDELLVGDVVLAGHGELVPLAAIEARLDACRSCGYGIDHPTPASVRVVDIARDDEGWIAQGRYSAHAQCPNCGAVYQDVIQRIEIDCAEYTCGRCGPETALKTDVLRLVEHDGDYIFTVALTCPRCSRRRRFTRALGAPFRVIKRIHVGADGVDVETHSGRT
jgi:predicted RNA-binding Zn-ribbon protein involved in translation (DUF1610 family)